MRKGKRIMSRGHIVLKSPYGDMKHNKKFRGFMRRGIAKVSMECSLIFMLHNILKLSEVLLKSTLFG